MPAAARQLNMMVALPEKEQERAQAARFAIDFVKRRNTENERYDRLAAAAREQDLVERGLAC